MIEELIEQAMTHKTNINKKIEYVEDKGYSYALGCFLKSGIVATSFVGLDISKDREGIEGAIQQGYIPFINYYSADVVIPGEASQPGLGVLLIKPWVGDD